MIDRCWILRCDNCLPQLLLRSVELAIEITVCELDRSMMQTSDDEDDNGADEEPSPLRDVERFLEMLGLAMEKQRRHAHRQREQRHAAERDRNAHYVRSADRLDDEQAKDAVDEIEQAHSIFGRREVAPWTSLKRVVYWLKSAMTDAGRPIRHPQITHFRR